MSRLPITIAALMLVACGDDPSQPAVPEANEVLGAVVGPPLDESAPEPEPEDLQPVEPETPPPTGGDARSISFGNLSLVGTDTTALIELMFSSNPQEGSFEFPSEVLSLDGQAVTIAGYQLPLEYEGDMVTRIMLVRDAASCCFGGMPRPDEWIDVTLSEPCPYWYQRAIYVTGELSIGLAKQDDDLIGSVYQIKAGVAALAR